MREERQALRNTNLYWSLWFAMLTLTIVLLVVFRAVFGGGTMQTISVFIVYLCSAWLLGLVAATRAGGELVHYLRQYHQNEINRITGSKVIDPFAFNNAKLLTFLQSTEAFGDQTLEKLKQNYRSARRIVWVTAGVAPFLFIFASRAY